MLLLLLLLVLLLLMVLMRVHPATMKPGDEMRRLRLLHRCFLKRQEGMITLHLAANIKWLYRRCLTGRSDAV